MDPLLEHLDSLIIELGVAGLLWIWAHGFYLEVFRKSLKEEQLVGVRFTTDLLLNRKIERVSLDKTSCLVQDYKSKNLIFVEVKNGFAPDRYSSHLANHTEMM